MPDDELTYMTDAHVAVIRAMDSRGLRLLYEIDFPPYRVDVYLPDFHAAVEVDGPKHSEVADYKRDRELDKTYRLRVFRIPAGDVNRPHRWMSKLIEFLGFMRDSKDERWEACEMKTPWL